MSIKRQCPVCHGDSFAVEFSGAEINEENNLRYSFVLRRLGHSPDGLEAMDLTQFMHGGPAEPSMLPKLRNSVAGRRLSSAVPGRYLRFRSDETPLSAIFTRLPKKKSRYAELLRCNAEVLEVGSHLGAFLQAAEEWGWRPTGLDIGGSTSDFARRQGLSVKRRAMENYSPHLRRPEAIFIWNCFEQVEDPSATLRDAYQILDRHGVLVVRVPNASYYRQRRRQLRRSRQSLRALGYNNLLGFPYLYGYTPSILTGLLRAHRFEPLAVHSSNLLTPPYPDMSALVKKEWQEISCEGKSSGQTGGPWIEIVSRRAAAN